MELDSERIMDTLETDVQVANAPKRNKKWIVFAVILLLLAAVIVGGVFAYQYFNGDDSVLSGENDSQDADEDPEDDEDSDANEDPEDDEDSETDEDPEDEETPDNDEDPDEQPENIDLTVRQAELSYELTDADIQDFNALLLAFENKAKQGTVTEDDIEALDEKNAYLQQQHTVSMVIYYCDLSDEAASKQYLDCTELVTQANNDYIEMLRRIYQSESSSKDIIFADWTEEELAMLTAYTDEIMQLNQRNSELKVAYRDAQNSAGFYEDMVPLYLEMVQNNNRIANIYGYDNYYEFAYSQVYCRDYDASEINAMREYVSAYIPETLEAVYDSLMVDLYQLNIVQITKFSNCLFESYNKNQLLGYLNSLPAQMRTDMAEVFDGNILLLSSAPGAMEGAFTTALGDDRSICFFGPGYDSIFTVVHELGHYYGCQYLFLDDIPLDLAEVQSQGNEWLFMSYLSGEMSEDLHRTVAEYQAYSALTVIMVSVIVDHFEERVYTHPDVTSLTSADLDAIMEDVCRSYGGLDFIEGAVADIQSYWRLVVLEQPVYYISYAVSGIAAMDLYAVAQEDYASAVEIYRSLCEDVSIEDGFLASILQAGLSGPFDESTYEEIYHIYCAQ